MSSYNFNSAARASVPPSVSYYSLCSSTRSCPMGVADYGYNGNQQYSYTPQGFQAVTTFTKLSISSSGQSPNAVSVLLDAVAHNIVQHDTVGWYWAQNVADITQSGSSFTISIWDNIWNWTADNAGMSDGTISGWCNGNWNGKVTPTPQGSFYGCVGPTITTSLPFKIVLREWVNDVNGYSSIVFYYEVWHGTTLLGSGHYDFVNFDSYFKLNPNYVVGGSNPRGGQYGALRNDAENVLGGNCCAFTAYVNQIVGTMKLAYATCYCNTFVSVPHAWSTGETSETIVNVHMSSPAVNSGKASAGADDNSQLW